MVEYQIRQFDSLGASPVVVEVDAVLDGSTKGFGLVAVRMTHLQPRNTYQVSIVVSSVSNTWQRTASVLLRRSDPIRRGHIVSLQDEVDIDLASFGPAVTFETAGWAATESGAPLRFKFGYYQLDAALLRQIADSVASGMELDAETALVNARYVPLRPVFSSSRAINHARVHPGLEAAAALAIDPNTTVAIILCVRARAPSGEESETVFTGSGQLAVLRIRLSRRPYTGRQAVEAASDNAAMRLNEIAADLQTSSNEDTLLAVTGVADALRLSAEVGSVLASSSCEPDECVGTGSKCIAGECVRGIDVVPPNHVLLPVCPGSSDDLFQLTDTFGEAVPGVECSGHGACMRIPSGLCGKGSGFKSAANRGQCSAVCACAAGWSGSSCSVADEYVSGLQMANGQAADVLSELFSSTAELTNEEAREATRALLSVFGDRALLPVGKRGAWHGALRSVLGSTMSRQRRLSSGRIELQVPLDAQVLRSSLSLLGAEVVGLLQASVGTSTRRLHVEAGAESGLLSERQLQGSASVPLEVLGLREQMDSTVQSVAETAALGLLPGETPREITEPGTMTMLLARLGAPPAGSALMLQASSAAVLSSSQALNSSSQHPIDARIVNWAQSPELVADAYSEA